MMLEFSSTDAPSALPDYAVEIKGLVKTYAVSGQKVGKRALRGIDLVVPKGSLYGILAPSEAGKTTLLAILSGDIEKTTGRVKIDGLDPSKDAESAKGAKCALGVMTQKTHLDSELTVRETLVHQAGLYGVPQAQKRADEILFQFDLYEHADEPTGTLSFAQRRRLMLAKAIVHEPSVLLLDEPTEGLTKDERQNLWDLIKKVNAGGATILLTTLRWDEADYLCTHLALMSQGALIANDTLAHILTQVNNKRITVSLARDIGDLPDNLCKMGWTKGDNRTISLVYKQLKTNLGSVLLAVQANGFSIADVKTEIVPLEEVFQQLITPHNPLDLPEKLVVGV